ncbi:hypothetical protein HMPREF2708_09055 [Corynebacterium sp. HMSC073H12]|nr:hypothetical protein HMPREF2708_09055 [Corynebacterium sp. HMSC073H12]
MQEMRPFCGGVWFCSGKWPGIAHKFVLTYARMWAQAPAASMAATKNRLATLTVVRRHLTSSSGSREEQWVMLAAAVVKRKL